MVPGPSIEICTPISRSWCRIASVLASSCSTDFGDFEVELLGGEPDIASEPSVPPTDL